MRTTALTLLAALLGILGASCGDELTEPDGMEASESQPALVDELNRRVPELLFEYRVPGVAVALLEAGVVEHQLVYGLADSEAQRPVTADTGFNIGSISKLFAAWGVMRLVEQGRIDLDASVEQYLTRWYLPESEFDSDGVTIRRLLSHTAGLTLEGYPGFEPGAPLPTLEESLRGATNGAGDVRLTMEPGKQWHYSGGGYTVLQLMIEEVTGEPFADYMQRNVLAPLGMGHSSFDVSNEILKASSEAHGILGKVIGGPRFTAMAAAGLETTVADLGRFAVANMGNEGGVQAGHPVLRSETLREMQAAAPATDGSYGLGYALYSFEDGFRTLGHDGANTGWYAQLHLLPESGRGIIVLTNGSNGWVLCEDIVCQWRKHVSPDADQVACQKPPYPLLSIIAEEESVAAALEHFAKLKSERSEEYKFPPAALHYFGYDLLRDDRVAEAIEAFKLNFQLFPEESAAAGSLGEAHLIAGNKDLAIKYLEKSLELNPESSKRAMMLEQARAMDLDQ